MRSRKRTELENACQKRRPSKAKKYTPDRTERRPRSWKNGRTTAMEAAFRNWANGTAGKKIIETLKRQNADGTDEVCLLYQSPNEGQLSFRILLDVEKNGKRLGWKKAWEKPEEDRKK